MESAHIDSGTSAQHSESPSGVRGQSTVHMYSNAVASDTLFWGAK